MTLTERKFKKQVHDIKGAVLKGSLLAVDPGSRSLGWAWFQDGEYMASGVYKAPSRTAPHERLIKIMDQLVDWSNPNVLAIEKMFKNNPSLIWSVGATIVTVKPLHLLEVPIRIWQEITDENYSKTDENDAIYIGKSVIYYANQD